MVRLLWAHVALLPLFAIARGSSPVHALFEISGIAALTLLAQSGRLPRRARSSLVVVALLTCSAVLVHLWDGQIEGHFHFFVMVTLLSTYEEWSSYLLAFAYVLLHHGLASLVDAASVFAHAGGREDPWLWAGIHALFIAGLGAVNIITWRLSEDARAETEESEAASARPSTTRRQAWRSSASTA